MLTLLAGVAVAGPIDVGDQELRTISFTRLVLEDEGAIYVTDEVIRREVLAELERWGYDSLGGESLVFGEDHGHAARVQLGGELVEGSCTEGRESACGITIEWQVYDLDRGGIVYTQQSAGAWRSASFDKAVRGAIAGSLQGLLGEDEFVEAVRGGDDSGRQGATITACEDGPYELPGQLEQAMDAVLLVELGGVSGSAVLVSPDGYALTAAHVVAGASDVQVHMNRGIELEAQVLRTQPSHDVALLKIPGAGWSCLEARAEPPPLGLEVYALGSPGGAELSFSVSRGIVSGNRTIGGVPLVQTDASINPGNSGGPLVDAQGQVVGIASFKMAGDGVEGLGFAVPATTALEQLDVQVGESSGTLVADAPFEPVVGARLPPRKPDWEAESTSTPSTPSKAPAAGSSPPLAGWGSLVAGAGATTVAGSFLVYSTSGQLTTPAWRGLQAVNTVGWLGLVGGGVMVVAGTRDR